MLKSFSKTSWLEFLELCLKMGTPDEFGHFFDVFLTPEEKDVSAARYMILKALVNTGVEKTTDHAKKLVKYVGFCCVLIPLFIPSSWWTA